MTPREASRPKEAERSEERQESQQHGKPYLRFLAMIATAMAAMYAVTYVNTFEMSHVAWSETRLFMTLLMGGTMAVIMLGFMLGMFKDLMLNVAIVLGAVILFGLATWLVRTQMTVEDGSYMSAMIPHHSIAILTSERSDLGDVRVCELAVRISEAQRREIEEMRWLIADIERNGAVETAVQAQERPVPSFEASATRTCPSGAPLA